MQCPKENCDDNPISQWKKAGDESSNHLGRDNGEKEGTSPPKNNSRSYKLLEPDGRKAAKSSPSHGYGDMTRASDRRATFENFPKRHLTSKIFDSGYFYSGEDDKTICHSCQALVFDWNEKDNPATFHEPHCKYHHMAEAMDEEAKPSLEGTSLLDIPITGANAISPPPVILQPTIASAISPKIKRNFSHSITVLREDMKHNYSGPQHQSLPVLGSSKFYGAVPPPEMKYLVTKEEVVEAEHEIYLKTLDLFSEEDRRKTFSVNDCWQMNTNGVLPFDKLAKNGFFYLGNLDRTKCFSCCKVFTKWLRKDNIPNVHKEFAPECKMVNGTELQNIPIRSLLATRESPLPTRQFLVENTVSNAYSSLSSFSAVDSNESALEISPLPLPMHEDTDEPPQNTMSGSLSDLNEPTSSGMNEPPHITMPGPLSDPNDPACSHIQQSPRCSDQNDVAQAPQITMSGALSDPNESSIAISSMLQPPTVQQNMDFQGTCQEPHFPVNANQEELSSNEMPLDLTTRQSAHATNIPARTGNQVPINAVQGVFQAMEQEPYPVQVSMEENEGQGVNIDPETSAPSHLGQTTLYTGVAGPQTPHTVVPPNRETFPFTTAPTTSRGEWAEAFPCLEPYESGMSSTVRRQETFDFTWATRGIHFTDEMARAGFYSSSEGDRVKCWYCGGGAHHWTPQDDPWEEHAKLYPNCEYLLQQKGPDYVSEVSSRYRAARPPTPVAHFRRSPSVASNSSESPFSSLEEVSPGPFRGPYFPRSPLRMFPRHAPSPPRFVDPREREASRKQMIETALNSELTLAAVEMGFDIKIIKKAIKRKVRSTDAPFPSQDALLDALLNPTADSESSDSEEEGPPPAPMLSNEPGTSTSNMEVTGTSETSNPVEGGGGEPISRQSALEGAENLDPRSLDEKLREYEQEKRCKVCLDRDAEVVFVPCGHLCTCVQCANALRTCPLCRKRIQTAMKVYTS